MQIRNVSKRSLTPLIGALIAVPALGDFVGVTWDGDAVLIDEVTGVSTLIGNTGHAQLNSMARAPSGHYIVANNGHSEIPHLDYLDPVLGDATVFHAPFLNSIRALAFSPAGVLYAVDSNASTTQSDLYTLDLSVPFGDSSIKQFIGTMSIAGVQGMAFAADGTLYGWAGLNGLVVIDPATAQVTDITGTLDGTTAIQTIAFAPDGTLYGAGDFLNTIDPVTGAYTQVGPALLGSVRGMEFQDSDSPVPFCFGDGTGAACPCSNSGQLSHGCENSSSTGGSVLTATGTASLSADTLQLTATGERPTPLSVVWQGSTAVGPLLYGDGHRCVGGVLKRLRIENAVGGIVTYPDGAETPIATRSAQLNDPISAGSRRYYQIGYRDPDPTFCPSPSGSTFNMSQGLAIVWAP